METFRITFCLNGDEENGVTITEFMAKDDKDAACLFKEIEPFANIIKIQLIE